MELTQKLERRHHKLAHIAELLKVSLDASTVDPAALKESAKLFNKLLKLTNKHLSQVDHVLYPQIMHIHQRRLRRNLARILTRTGHVRSEVRVLIKAWTPKLVRKRSAVFQSVAWHFLTILTMRLMGEQKIYAILNRCEIPLPSESGKANSYPIIL